MWFWIFSIYFLCCFLPLVLPESSKFRYYACFISFSLLVTFFSCVHLIVYIFTRDNRNYGLRKFALDVISGVLGFQIITKIERNIEARKAIIVVNHQSSLDMIMCCEIFDRCRNCTCVVKKEVAYLGPLGIAALLGDFIFIDRKNKDLAKKQLSEETDKYFTRYKNGKILVFPEGTRNKIGAEFLEFKKGAFYLAIEKQAAILPVVISPLKFIKSNKYFRKGSVIISFLNPISTEGMVSENVEDLIGKTRKVMIDEYEKLKIVV